MSEFRYIIMGEWRWHAGERDEFVVGVCETKDFAIAKVSELNDASRQVALTFLKEMDALETPHPELAEAMEAIELKAQTEFERLTGTELGCFNETMHFRYVMVPALSAK